MKETNIVDQGRRLLNEIIPDANNLEINIDNSILKIQYVVGKIPIKNIAKIHRNKSVENYYLFEEVICGGENPIKVEVDFLYCELLSKATLVFKEIADKLTAYKNKKWNILLKKQIIDKINEYNDVCLYFEEYDLKDNIIDILIRRYNKYDITNTEPGTFLRLFILDKQTLQDLGYYDAYKDKLIEIVKAKEAECDDYWVEKYEEKLKFLNNVSNSIKAKV